MGFIEGLVTLLDRMESKGEPSSGAQLTTMQSNFVCPDISSRASFYSDQLSPIPTFVTPTVQKLVLLGYYLLWQKDSVLAEN